MNDDDTYSMHYERNVFTRIVRITATMTLYVLMRSLYDPSKITAASKRQYQRHVEKCGATKQRYRHYNCTTKIVL